MHSAFLPDWLRVVWAVLLFATVAAHAAHVSLMSGQRRWWHLGHTAMAAAMMLMYLVPPMSSPGPYRALLALFAVATLAVTAAAVLLWRREGTLNPLWVASGVDMLAMTYMLLPMQARVSALSYLFALYLAATAVAWAAGLWKRAPAFRQALPAAAGAGAGAGAGESSPAPSPIEHGDRTLGLTAECSADVPITLAVMAASMSYMLAVM